MSKFIYLILSALFAFQMSLFAQSSPLPKSQDTERTLSIIKPDSVKNHHIGEIISRFEKNGLNIVDLKMVKLNREQAAQFYNEHRERPFFPELIEFMSSGPIVVMILEGKQAINKNREMMGPTDPSKAQKGTLRADFGKSTGENAVHGSDSPEAAQREIQFFFKP